MQVIEVLEWKENDDGIMRVRIMEDGWMSTKARNGMQLLERTDDDAEATKLPFESDTESAEEVQEEGEAAERSRSRGPEEEDSKAVVEAEVAADELAAAAPPSKAYEVKLKKGGKVTVQPTAMGLLVLGGKHSSNPGHSFTHSFTPRNVSDRSNFVVASGSLH